MISPLTDIAVELDFTEIEYEIDDNNCTREAYIRLRDTVGDTGIIIECKDRIHVTYYFWEANGGARTRDYEFTSVTAMMDDFDRFILTYYSDAVTPNPYFGE